MKSLRLHNTNDISQLAHPQQPKNLSLDSPALDFLVDLNKVDSPGIHASMPAVEVKQLMQRTHTRVKFIIDEHQQLTGIVCADDLIDRRLVQKVSQGFIREEIPVSEFMTPKKSLKALNYHDVVDATISDIIASLKSAGEQHCLVVDQEQAVVRGIFSAHEVSKNLNMPIHIQKKPHFLKPFIPTI